jgi:hypothetical protein
MSSSTDRRREPQKFANSNLNGIFAGKPTGAQGASSGVNRFGMLTMALPKVSTAAWPAIAQDRCWDVVDCMHD